MDDDQKIIKVSPNNKVVPIERGPGRPIAVRRAPSARRLARVEQDQAALAAHVAADPIVAAAGRRDPRQVLHEARLAAAVEAASVAFEKSQRPIHDREFARLCSRRVALLAEVARLSIQLHSLDPSEPAPAVVERILKLLVSDVTSVAREILDPEQVDRLIEGWRRRVHEGAPALDVAFEPADALALRK